MRLRPLLLLVIPALCSAQTVIRADVRLVNVSFSVRDALGNFVTDIGSDDVEVTEDGVPQKVSFFARATEVPLNLALILDFSGSQDQFIRSHHKDLETFLKTVLAARDRAFLVGFSNNPRLVTELTASPGDIISALQGFEHAGNRRIYPLMGHVEIRDPCCATALYDAIYYPIVQVLAPVEHGRRAAVVFSDGEDNLSANTEFEVIEAAQNSNTVLYCLRYTHMQDGKLTARNKYGTTVMRRMARDTGGEEFDAKAAGLDEHFRQIAEQLHSSYELAYHSTNPTNDGAFRKLSIHVNRPGLTVRAKAGYYAR
jgi:Ca-activated chloride channel family protein